MSKTITIPNTPQNRRAITRLIHKHLGPYPDDKTYAPFKKVLASRDVNRMLSALVISMAMKQASKRIAAALRGPSRRR